MTGALDHPMRKGSSSKANRAQPEFQCWRAMHYRCKHREGYADRGITVCRRWQSFELFVLDMGARPSPAHTIERKRNNKGYTPYNCYWATRSVQNKNRRSVVVVEGKPLFQWAEDLGLKYQTFYKRFQRYSAGTITKQQLLHKGAAHHWCKHHARN